MRILVTGAAGFVGRNLVENMKNIRDGKNRTRPRLSIDEIYEYDRTNSLEQLDEWCAKADYVFNLAGVNRPKEQKEYGEGNVEFSCILLNLLRKHENKCAVMLASSLQATLVGRFEGSEYGITKREGEALFFRYAEETGANVYVYRFPNIVGKWIKPNYNSAVGTFCNNIANDLPISVNDPDVMLELLFIDDLINEMFDLLEGHPHRAEYPEAGKDINGIEYDGLTPYPSSEGKYCYVPVTHKATLGRIVELLQTFHEQPRTLIIPPIAEDSLEKKLYSMYLSYMPKENVVVDLKMNRNDSGSFTELLKTTDHGQVSVNICKPGCTKGQHWHNLKWEFFIVVSGHGLIQERKIGTDEIMEFEVSGDKIQAVHILPGYTHRIVNLSSTENLVTVMWANEIFDPDHPDTYFEDVNTELCNARYWIE